VAALYKPYFAFSLKFISQKVNDMCIVSNYVYNMQLHNINFLINVRCEFSRFIILILKSLLLNVFCYCYVIVLGKENVSFKMRASTSIVVAQFKKKFRIRNRM